MNALPPDPDTPLRLHVAAKLAFPDGSMTVSGLRREWKRGNLVIYRVAGKDFTTLAEIKKMRVRCQGNQPHQDSTFAAAPTAPANGSSSTGDSRSAQARLRRIAAGLKRRSSNT